MTAREAQEKFSAAFRAALADEAAASGLAVRLDGRMPWLEETGTYPEGSRGWWVSAGLRPVLVSKGHLYPRDDETPEYTPMASWPSYVTVSYTASDEAEPSTSLLDVEVTGAGAHLAAPLAAMAVAAVARYLSDRDLRIESLREQKARLADELTRVSNELFELDGIAD